MNTKKSITFEIAGGLGNQLFMLCAGLYFEQQTKRRLIFDVTDLKRISSLHPGQNVCTLGLLDGFETVNKKNNEIIFKGLHNFCERAIKRIRKLGNFANRETNLIVEEIGFFDLDRVTNSTKQIQGYFQTWRYYEGLQKKPILGIDLIAEPTNWFFEMAESLKCKKVAAFHIRRGDYALSRNRSSGMLSGSYFESVAKLLPKDIEIWVFTDSPDTIIDEVQCFEQKTFIIEPPLDSDPFESAILISRASYIAISNSTFSWWAATIAPPCAKVYAPTKWFEHRPDPLDLIPSNWIRMKSEWEFQK
jgi:hypothetical protein